MKKDTNQETPRKYKVYIHRLKKWVEVTEEQYYAYYRDISDARKRTQAHVECMCPKPKNWMCYGNCLACKSRSTGDNLSLDYTVEGGEGNQKSWTDELHDDSPDAQSIMEDSEKVDAPTAPAEPSLTLEQVRTVLAEKSRQDLTAEILSLLQKSNTETVDKIKAAIEAVCHEAQSEIIGNSNSVPTLADIKTPLRDGNMERTDDPYYANAYFINANSKTVPGVVDADSNPEMNHSKVRRSVYGCASINLYAIKSIVTLVLTGVFAYLAISGQIAVDNFVDMFQIILIFYFGTQSGNQL